MLHVSDFLPRPSRIIGLFTGFTYTEKDETYATPMQYLYTYTRKRSFFLEAERISQ